MSVRIICIGNELLTGEVTESNSKWLIQELNKHSLKVECISIIEDDEIVLKNLLSSAISDETAFVLLTGGMGPTSDDITVKAISSLLNLELYLDRTVLKSMKHVLETKNKPFLDIMKKQAMVPRGVHLIPNKIGTAMGILVKSGNTTIICLPGVPREMKFIMKSEILPVINKENQSFTIRKSAICSKTEIEVSNVLEALNFSKFKTMKLAYLLHEKGMKINIENSGKNASILDQELHEACEMIKEKLESTFDGIQVRFT